MMSIIEHFSDFLETTKDFSGKNKALRWSIFLGGGNKSVM